MPFMFSATAATASGQSKACFLANFVVRDFHILQPAAGLLPVTISFGCRSCSRSLSVFGIT